MPDPALDVLSAGDSAAARAIWNAGMPHAPLSEALFDEKVWQDADITEDMRIAAFDRDGQLVGFGVGVPRGTVPGAGSIKLVAVDPRVHRQGIGSAIVKSLLSRLNEDGCSIVRLGESPPNYLQPGVDAEDTRANQFFQSLGFAPLGTAQDMACPLKEIDLDTTAEERRLAATGIIVRRAGHGDREANVLAAIGELWSPWLPEIRSALAQSPPALHIAEAQDGTFAGFAAHSANNRSVGWFGPMGTHPDFRGLGIGAALLRRCLSDLRDAGFDSAIIPWVAPVTFYERTVGARICRSYLRYELALKR